MKDPYTRAFVVKLWRWELFEIWHRDRHGAAGACGWAFPHLTDKQHRALKDMAWMESRTPYFLRCPGKIFNGSRADAECLYRALVFNVALIIGCRVTFEYATHEAIMKIHHRGSDFTGANVFCWQPGYHSNNSDDTPQSREDYFLAVICGIARDILADHRPWWQHPKWHVHHWRLGGTPVRWFKRMFVWRCKYCHGRFKRKEAPCSDYSATQYWHLECEGQRTARSRA